MTRTRRIPFAAMFHLVIASALGGQQAQAQSNPQALALKSNESVELQQVFWIANCRSIAIGLPVVEVLEGPEELSLSIKEANVLPGRQNCADGRSLALTTGEVRDKRFFAEAVWFPNAGK